MRFVEIGIGGTADEIGGRSLLAWRAYFPFATLVACDLNDRSALARRRTRIVRLDQGDPRELAAFAKQGPFDVVVDDGSHLGSHQWMTFTALFDTLTEDGLYVVEDVQTSYWDRMVGGVIWGGANPSSSAFAGTCVGRFLDLAKHLNYAEFLDEADADPELRPLARRIRHITFEHNLVMIVKGSNEVPSNTVVRSGPPGSSETGGSG
ncbi:hypothetical protein [uncultured Enterovirga sp.]|uniref:hypothetical protein n=1 Tax=uncultured Enterovirga sp. TaxID=2026352 RepID=UPI0035C96A60